MRTLHAIAAALLLPSAALAAGDSADAIAAGFEKLGMPAEKAACYGETITGQLDEEKSREAAEIVSSAGNSQEVREGVTNSGPTMMNAFSAANQTCGE